MPGLLSWVVTVIRGSKFEASDVVPGPGSNIRHPLSVFSFPPPGPAGPVPRLHQYYEGATTSCRPSRRASFPSLGDTSVALVVFAPRRTSAPSRPGVGRPVSPAGRLPRRRQDLPSSWRTSIVRLHMFPSDSGRIAYTRPVQCSNVALGISKAKAPTKGLSKLNSMAFGLAVYASQGVCTKGAAQSRGPTQDSLPAAGQALPDGLYTRKVPTKGFKVASLHLIPLSQAWLGTMKSTYPLLDCVKSTGPTRLVHESF